MVRFLLRWVINAVALYAAIFIIGGITFNGTVVGIMWLALIFGLVNAILRPVLKFFSLPLLILTLGLFSLVINTFLFWLTSVLVPTLVISPPVFWNAFLGGLVVSLVSVFLSLVLKDELKGKKRKS